MVMYWKCWLSSLWPAAVFIASIVTAVEDTTSRTATTGTVSSQKGCVGSQFDTDLDCGDCLTELLSHAGASHDKIRSLQTSGSLILASLDENRIKSLPADLLSLVLAFNLPLAKSLKDCVGGTKICPASASETIYPCTKTGQCVFNATRHATQCMCPNGLQGKRCRQDVDECSDPSLNSCDLVNGQCVNAYGFYTCRCNTGYEGVRGICVDINECDVGSHNCHANASCSNTNGSYTCQCSPGFHGDGMDCQYDFCSSSRDRRLCRKVDILNTEMMSLKEHISSQSRDMKLLLGLFSKYELRLLKQEKHTKRRIAYEASKMASRFDDLANSTTSRLDDLASSTTSRVDDLANSTTSRLHDITYTTRSRLDDVKVALEEKIDSKCTGILHWKTFTRTTRINTGNWNVQFSKERNDTSIRIWYTSSMGVVGANSGWECFTLSFLFDGSECSDPAPVRGGVSSHDTGNDHKSVPAAISGVCHITRNGTLQITSSLVRECSTHHGYYHGYYEDGRSITSSLHIEEMCPDN